MIRSVPVVLVACVALLGCKKDPGKKDPAAAKEQHLFLDVHHLGKGKAALDEMAAGHQLDLAKQGPHHTNYRDYWVDVDDGNVYCLAEAPSAAEASAVHHDVDGTVADQIWPVVEAPDAVKPTGQAKLFMDTHNFGAGKITAEAFAEAHKKDQAIEGKYGVHFVNYWVDATSGTVHCLVEAPNKEAIATTHKEANGFVPESVDEVVHGK